MFERSAQVVIGLGVFIFAAVAPCASDPKYVEELIESSRRLKLAESRPWQKILFMRSRIFGGSRVYVDDPAFLIAGPGARSDPRLEMEAELRAFASPESQTFGTVTRHPQCRYAARFAFLRQALSIDAARFEMQPCPEVDKFLAFADYSGVSLVFSNYFVDNPASMFGHTLLRLRRDTASRERSNKTGLLDDAANFAALVPALNPLTYPAQGLLGLFRGRFALMPYSEKIQEYNNYESRDLWEFGLDLKPDEIRRLTLLLWEVGDFSSSYYYLDENCSFALLALLEAAKPELNLTDAFHLYAIPSDTVKAVTSQPRLVTSIDFKASARTRYLRRADELRPGEDGVFLDVIDRFKTNFSSAELEAIFKSRACDSSCQTRVLDAVVEYIDFREKKISARAVDAWGDLRVGALRARARLRQASSPLRNDPPEDARPDRGPRSGMVEVIAGWSSRGYNLSEFRWRPAHHDVGSSRVGYSDQLEIQVLDWTFARDDELNKIYLKRFAPLELLSLGEPKLALSPFSWRVALDYVNERSHRDFRSLDGRGGLDAAFGLARFAGPFAVYALAGIRGGYSTEPDFGWHAGAGPRAGAFWSLNDRLKLSASFSWTALFGEGSTYEERREIETRLSYAWRKETEFNLRATDAEQISEVSAGARFYF